MTTTKLDQSTLFNLAEDIATETLYWAIGRDAISRDTKRAADDRLEVELTALIESHTGLRPSYEELAAFKNHLVSTVSDIDGSDVL